MRAITGAARALFALLLMMVMVSCGGGNTDPRFPGPGINIGDLDINIRPLSANQGSRIIAITLQVPPTGISQTIPARIHIGYRFNRDRSDPLRFMTAAPGSIDLNNPATVIDIPPAGREIVFFWDAATDIGEDGAPLVIVRAGILRADVTDPREAVCDFEPEFAIDFGAGLACTSEAPDMTGGQLDEATIGLPYSVQLPVTGGEPPLRFELVEGPDGQPAPTNAIGFGLALDPATGIVGGTPTADAPALIPFVARVIDNCGQAEGQRAGSQATPLPGGRFDQASFVIPTNGAIPLCDAPGPDITTTSLPGGQVDAPYSTQLEASGGDGTITWTASGLEGTGLTMGTSGLISGAPLAAGDITVTVTATDSCDSPQTDEETFTIPVDCSAVAPSFGGSTDLPDAFIGTPYDQTIDATLPNGTGSVQVVGGSLPDGITVGTSTLGARTIRVSISGTPNNSAQAGQTFNFTLRATDGCPTGPLSTDETFTLTVQEPSVCPEPAPEITTQTLPQGVAGELYSATLSVIGGTPVVGPITIISGSLPGDLAIGADGRTIEGTLPTGSEGSYQVTLRVEDNCQPNPRSDQVTLTLDVVAGCTPVVITTTSLPDAVNGSSYNVPLVSAGGTGAQSWTLINGELPNALTLDANGLISGVTSDTPGDYTFDVQVTDSCPGDPSSDTATLTITVVDDGGCPAVTITTRQTDLVNPIFNTPYDEVVEAGGGTPPIGFTLTSGSLPTGVTLNADGTLTGTPTDPLEIDTEFTFEVTATDSCSPIAQSDVETYTLTLLPSGACPDPVVITTETLPDPQVGAPYDIPIETTGGVPPLRFALQIGELPTGLALNTDTGVIEGTPSDDGQIGTEFVFTIQVLDSCPKGQQVDTQTYTVTLQLATCATLVEITTTELPDARLNGPYNETVATTGGVAPFTFELTDGELPSGLTLNADGTITGTPNDPNDVDSTFTFDVTVTDTCVGKPSSDTQTLSIFVDEALCDTLAITNTSFPNPLLGVPYNASLLASGGFAPRAWSLVSGSLPTGMIVEPEGTISGIPTDPTQVGQLFTFTLQVADECPKGIQTDQATFSFTLDAIVCDPLAITTTDLPDPQVGFAYDIPVETSGGFAPLEFVLQIGELPTGLTLNSVTGVIEGTPTDDTQIGQDFTFTVQVLDDCPGGQQVDTETYTVTLQLPTCATVVEFDDEDVPDAFFNTPYNTTLGITGGVAPFTFELIGGSLPSGLTLNADGSITGTPDDISEVGDSFVFEAMVTDTCVGNPSSDERTYSMDLLPEVIECVPVEITNSSFPDPVLGSAYNASLLASGGEGTLTWTLSGGSLPTGLTVEPEGTLSGTPTDPTQVGTEFTFTLLVSDECVNGTQTDEATFSFTLLDAAVCEPTPDITTLTIPNPSFNTPYSTTIEVDGGVDPLTFELDSGLLPTGLTLNPATGEISGTPSESEEIGLEFIIEITVTDSCPFNPGTDTQEYTFTLLPEGVDCADPPVITTTDVPDPILGTLFSNALLATGGEGALSWSLTGGSLPTGLALNSDGTITGTATLPTEVGTEFTFTATVTDSCEEPQSDEATYSFTLLDAAVCEPTPEITTETIADPFFNTPYSATIEVDGGLDPLAFAITAGSLPSGLGINASTGEISGTPNAIGEVGSSFTFTVTVTDSCPFNPGTDSQEYTIDLLPEVVECAPLAITSTGFPDAVLGSAYNATLLASGGEGTLTWALTGGSLPTGLTVEPEGTISGTPTDPTQVDTEFTFTVTVSDECVDGTQTDEATFSITLLDAIVCEPTPVITTETIADPLFNTPYSATIEVDGGLDPLAFAITAGSLPSGLGINALTGEISGTPNAIGEVGSSFTFTVTVTDSCPFNPGTDSQEYTIDLQPEVVECAPLEITNELFPDPVLGAAYNATLLASGGEGTLTWELTSGSLPTGLILEPEGTISGTPTDPSQVGTLFLFTLSVSDECPDGIQTDEEAFAFTLLDAEPCDPPVQLTTETLPDAAIGTPYSTQIETTGGTTPFDFDLASGTLPTGIVLSESGLLNGTPSNVDDAGETFVVGIQVTDSCPFVPSSDIRNYSLFVQPIDVCAPIEILNTGFPNPVLGQGYNVALIASGEAPFTWALVDGSLPTGMSVDSDGFLTGNPSDETQVGDEFTFTLRVTDSCDDGEQIDEAEFTFVLQPALDCDDPSITTETLPNPVLAAAYNQTVEVTGGVEPYAFTIEGALPAGMTLDAGTGAISGTPNDPTQVGQEFTFEVTVTDSCTTPGVDSQSYTVTLQPAVVECTPVVITPAELPNAVLGQLYSQGLALTGGTAPFSWALVSGSLPTGVTVGANGIVSGTPTDPSQVGGSFTFTVEVTDSCPNGALTDQETFTIDLDQAIPCETVPVITTETVPNPVFATPYNTTVNATGGVGDLTFALTAGALPTGLTVNSDGTITGTPSDAGQVGGTFSFTVTVTDECPFLPGTDSQNYTITLEPAVVECDPVEIENTSFPGAIIGVPFNASLIASGGTPPFSWTLVDGSLPAGLAIVGSSISGTPNDPSQAGQLFEFTLRVSDACANGAQIDEESFSILLRAQGSCDFPPEITTLALPNACFGRNYLVPLEVSGGLAPYLWQIIDGVVPNGIGLDDDGKMVGIPLDESDIGETFTFTVEVTDSCLPTGRDTQVYTLTVDDCGEECGPVDIVNTGFPNPQIGQAYNATLLVNGGNPGFTWELVSGSLPSGMSINPIGSITGTPNDPSQALQTFTFTIRVTDSCPGNPATDEATFSFVLLPLPNCSTLPTITTESVPDPELGTFYSAQFQATSGVPPYTWDIIEGSLPAGLSLGSNGALTGTPSDPSQVGDTFTFDVRVTDDCNLTPGVDVVRYTFTLQGGAGVCDPLEILNESFPDPFFSQGYNVSLLATGTAPFSWSLTGGSLPDGLTVNPSGALTGTPTNASQIGTTFTFTLRADDACPNEPNRFDEEQFSFTLRSNGEECDPIEITTDDLPDPRFFHWYSQQIQVEGGTEPFTFELVDGRLPKGLRLNEDGVICGKPCNPCEIGRYFTFTVRVTDSCPSGAQSDEQEITIKLRLF